MPASQEDAAVSLDLRDVACPMAFVRARLFLDKQASGITASIVFTRSPGNEGLPRSLEALGHSVVARRTLAPRGPHPDEHIRLRLA